MLRELDRRAGHGQGVSDQYSQHGYSVSRQSAPPGSGAQLALGIVSTVALIPISIVLGVTSNWFAMLLAVAAILGVNAAHAWHLRQQGPRGR